MCNPEQKMRNNRTTYGVVLQGVVKEYPENTNNVFIFFEGKDSAYYKPRLDIQLSNVGVCGINKNCDGKDNVKKLIIAIKNNNQLSNINSVYFIDRDYGHDLDDLEATNKHDVYITDGYSIENYYTERSSVYNLISAVFYKDKIHDDKTKQAINQVLDLYCEMQEKYHKEVFIFNKWSWVQRHLRVGRKQVSLDFF